MGFGFGVGDFLAVINLANKIRKDFSGAPEQYQAIASELRNFSTVLQDVEVYVAGLSLPASKQTHLHEILSSCCDTLEAVDKIVSKYSSLDLSTPCHSLPQQARRIWRRLKLEPSDIRDLRDRIVADVALLGTYLDGLERVDIAKLVSQQGLLIAGQNALAKKQDSLEYEQILDWLGSPDYKAQHVAHARQRLTGTGQWLCKLPEYQKWLNVRDSCHDLYLEGIPGSGKTILTSMIIDELEERHGSSLDIGRSYYYCDYNRQSEQQLGKMLLCLLRQLAESTISPAIKGLYDQCHKKGDRPSLASIRSSLHALVAQRQHTFIVIDALDECQAEDGLRASLISELRAIKNLSPGVRLAITSRPMQDLTNELQTMKKLGIRASDEDVTTYVMGNIHRLPHFVARNSALQQEIVHAIVKAVDGIFLLATLHIQALVGKRSARHLRSTLQSLAASGYSDAYATTMSRICAQGEDQKELALDTLIWVVHARRSLTSLELLHALATVIDSSEFYEDSISDLADVLSACCGLIVVEPGTEIVRLVHRTTLEFFQGPGKIFLVDANTKISNICYTYLALDALTCKKYLSDETLKERILGFPLYEYASLHWQDHTEAREQPMTVEQIAEKQQKVHESSQALLKHETPQYFRLQRKNPDITGLHLVCYYGLTALLPQFVAKYDIDGVNHFGQTPLSCAIQQNHFEVAKLLVDRGARLDQMYVRESRARDGHNLGEDDGGLPPGGLRLARSDANSKGSTLLMWAIGFGYQHMVELLINAGADANATNHRGATPFLLAAAAGSEDTIRMLLAKRVDPCVVDEKERSALTYALNPSCSGFHFSRAHQWGFKPVEMLLEFGVDPYKIDRRGRTLFHHAIIGNTTSWLNNCINSAESKHAEGAPSSDPSPGWMNMIDTRDEDGMTPLMVAAKKGYNDTLRFFLARGASVDARNHDQQTALTLAVLADRFEIVSILIESGAKVDLTDKDGRTPLYYAASQNMDDIIVKKLLEAGASVHSVDKHGWTPLFFAASRYLDDTIVKTLLEAGADVNARTMHQNVPLMSVRDPVVIRLMIQRGADPFAVDDIGATVLHYLSLYENVELVTVFLEIVRNSNRISDILAKYDSRERCEASSSVLTRFMVLDKLGRSALHWSAMNPNYKALVYFQKLGFDPFLADVRGKRVLEYVVTYGDNDTVMRVLGLGQWTCKEEEEAPVWSALHWACQKGDFVLVKILSDAGFKSTAVRTYEPPALWTPIDVAIFWGNSNLITPKGTLRDDLDWHQVTASGVVSAAAAMSGSLIPVRCNDYKASKKHITECIVCRNFVAGKLFECLTCPRNLAFCMMCRQGIDVAHPGHRWQISEPQDSLRVQVDTANA